MPTLYLPSPSTTLPGRRLAGILLCLLNLFWGGPAAAAEPAGAVTKTDGTVLLFHDGEVRGRTVNQSGTGLFVGDSVKTKRNSTCNIRFIDQSKIILTENSSLTIRAIDHANVDGGVVLFDIKKRGQVKGLNISTATITIGVKGTRFAVVQEQNGAISLYLKEGELAIESNRDDFKIDPDSDLLAGHENLEKRLRQDFEATREKLRSDFEESKRSMREGNAAFLRTFAMSAGTGVSIDADNQVFEIRIPVWIEEQLSLLDAFEE